MLNQGTTGRTTNSPDIAPVVIRDRGHKPPKASQYVTGTQLKDFINAVRFADSQKLGLSVHATIHWQATGRLEGCHSSVEADQECARMRTRLLSKLKRWLTKKGMPVAYAWVNEVGKTYGEHTHLFIHLPHYMRYAKGTQQDRHAAWIGLVKRLEDYLYRVGGFKDYENRPDHRNKAIKLTYGRYGMHSKGMLAGAIKYLVKGLSPTETVQTGFGRVPLIEYLGVTHKGNARATTRHRYGLSHSIGPKAQREAGFVPVSSVEDAYTALHPKPAFKPLKSCSGHSTCLSPKGSSLIP